MQLTKKEILSQLEIIKQSVEQNVSSESGSDFIYEEMESSIELMESLLIQLGRISE